MCSGTTNRRDFCLTQNTTAHLEVRSSFSSSMTLTLEADDESIRFVIRALTERGVEVRFTKWSLIRSVDPDLNIQYVNVAICSKQNAQSKVCVDILMVSQDFHGDVSPLRRMTYRSPKMCGRSSISAREPLGACVGRFWGRSESQYCEYALAPNNARSAGRNRRDASKNEPRPDQAAKWLDLQRRGFLMLLSPFHGLTQTPPATPSQSSPSPRSPERPARRVGRCIPGRRRDWGRS